MEMIVILGLLAIGGLIMSRSEASTTEQRRGDGCAPPTRQDWRR